MTFAIRQQCGESGSALGAALGEVHFGKIVEAVKTGSQEGELVWLNFDGVDATNGSYLKSVVLRLLLCGRLTVAPTALHFAPDLPPLDIFPLVVNPSDAVRQELVEFLSSRNLPLAVAGALESTNTVAVATIEGGLEPVLRQTLSRVVAAGEASAPTLHAEHPKEGVAVTAWNNRLTELCALRLLRRRRLGRSWLYQSIANKIHYGTSIH